VADLPAIERPNGKLYRPRKLVACPVSDQYDEIAAVVVFGTHDPDRAQALADSLARRDVDSGYVAANPGRVWWRDGFECGQRTWAVDDEHGRAGVLFEIVEGGND
jgi:hypothetical protein